MSTKFPDNIQTFGRFQDMTYNDWEMLSQYRQAMADSDFATAQQALRGISKLKNKLLTNGFMNDMLDTCYAVQDFFDNRQVPDYVVSLIEPIGQKKGDLWFETSPVVNAVKFQSDSSFSISIDTDDESGFTWDGVIKYSTDGDIWNVWNGSSVNSALSNNQNVLYFIGENNTTISFKKIDASSGKIGTWKISGENVYCYGNLENLLDYKVTARGGHPSVGERAFYSMLAHNDALISSPEILSPIISEYVYYGMFWDCKNLKYAPSILPASIVPSKGYGIMFQECPALISPPIMSGIEEIMELGCASMFQGCSSLEKIPQMNVSTFGNSACDWMFVNCSKLKLSETKDAEYTNSYNGCLGNSFGTDCFKYMFLGTGGTFTGTPTINTTYYTSNEVI